MASVLQRLIFFSAMVHLVLCRVRYAKTHVEVTRSPHSMDKKLNSEDEVIRDNTDVTQISEKCKNTYFCLEGEVNNYPEKLAEELVRRTNVAKAIEHIPPQIGQRLDPGNNNVIIPICPSQRKVIYPKTLKNAEGVHKSVLNPKRRPLQGFHVVLCDLDETTNQPKSHSPLVNLAFQDGYKSTGCQQRFIDRWVVLINGTELVWSKMPIPVWCSFDITKDKPN